jgi:hypothetical protein
MKLDGVKIIITKKNTKNSWFVYAYKKKIIEKKNPKEFLVLNKIYMLV